MSHSCSSHGTKIQTSSAPKRGIRSRSYIKTWKSDPIVILECDNPIKVSYDETWQFDRIVMLKCGNTIQVCYV